LSYEIPISGEKGIKVLSKGKLKMLKSVLESIAGIDIFPIISLAVFTLVFGAMLLWVFKLDKKTVSKMKKLPLDDN